MSLHKILLLIVVYVCSITIVFGQNEDSGVWLSADDAIEDTASTEVDTTAIAIEDTHDNLPWPERMCANIDALLQNEMFRRSQVGIEIYDIDADSALYIYNGEQVMRPASTMKLLTAVTALDLIGRNLQYQTSLYMTGDIVDSVLVGDLYCRGGFDPAFNYTDLHEFARVVKSIGIDSISGFIYADHSMKDDVKMGEGWSWDDDNPELSALLVGRKSNFCEQFVEHLRDVGIKLNVATSLAHVPDTATELTTCRRNIDQILVPMLKESDNLYAESLFFKIAEASAKTPVCAKDARRAEEHFLKKLGFDSESFRVADGSGLSLYNYLTPAIEVAILKYAYRNDYIRTHLLPALPESGFDGTLRRRMKASPALGNIRAKTGTLAAVTTLAGYATAANGHTLCFAIMNQGVMKASKARHFQDAVCKAMCR